MMTERSFLGELSLSNQMEDSSQVSEQEGGWGLGCDSGKSGINTGITVAICSHDLGCQ